MFLDWEPPADFEPDLDGESLEEHVAKLMAEAKDAEK